MKIKYFLLFPVLALLIYSCGFSDSNRTNDSDTRRTDTSEDSDQASQSDYRSLSFVDMHVHNVDSTDFVIIPIGIYGNKKRSSKRSSSFQLDGSPKFNYFYGGDWGQGEFFNLVFFNVRKDTSYLLLKGNERHIINQFSPNINQAGEWAKEFIFYDITSNDYNLDKKLNFKDGSQLFVSGKDGKNLVRVTPNNTDLIQWQILNNSSMILAKVLVDKDQDKEFDWKNGKDEFEYLKIDLRNPKLGRPVLGKEMKEILKNQFVDLKG